MQWSVNEWFHCLSFFRMFHTLDHVCDDVGKLKSGRILPRQLSAVCSTKPESSSPCGVCENQKHYSVAYCTGASWKRTVELANSIDSFQLVLFMTRIATSHAWRLVSSRYTVAVFQTGISSDFRSDAIARPKCTHDCYLVECGCLLARRSMWCGRNWTMFWSCLLPPSSGQSSGSL